MWCSRPAQIYLFMTHTRCYFLSMLDDGLTQLIYFYDYPKHTIITDTKFLVLIVLTTSTNDESVGCVSTSLLFFKYTTFNPLFKLLHQIVYMFPRLRD